MKNNWKKAAAGVLAMAIIVGAMPADISTGGLFGSTAIVASAAETAATAPYVDGTILHLAGSGWTKTNLTAANLKSQSGLSTNVSTSSIEKIICDEGTVLPSDCTTLLASFSNATEIDLTNADFSNVKIMKAMFGRGSASNSTDRSELKTIKFGDDINTSLVTDMSYLFNRCTGLTSVDLSSFNTANVTTMASMFRNCSSLTGTLDLSNFNTANVTSMSYMFNGCSNLSTIDISSFSTNSNLGIGSMFNSCSNLETIYAGTKWNKSFTSGTVFTNS